LAAVVVVISTSMSPQAQAGCNIIPGTALSFGGALGASDRPFAGPGDFVELRLVAGCHDASPGFSANAADHVVTVVFRPPNGGPQNAVVLATDCVAISSDVQDCANRVDIASATCVAVNGVGDPVGIEVVENPGDRRLRFRFPDTDPLFVAADDDLTYSGSAAIAVSSNGATLPCALATETCADQSGLIACIDTLFALDGTCGTSADVTFSHFTALPPPNNYQAICTDPVSVCTGLEDRVRFVPDAAGNILLPMDWRGVLVDRDAVPVARLLRGTTGVEAFEGGGSAITIPGNSFLASYSPEGGKLPPLFDPQSDPMASNEVTFFGSSDAPQTVLRVARRGAPQQECSGGANNGLPCNEAADCPNGACGATTCIGGGQNGMPCTDDTGCPGGECGPALFDFTTRLLGGIGPVVLEIGACLGGISEGMACVDDLGCPGGQCGAFQIAALDPVPLDGLNQTEDLNAFVVSEAIEDVALNDDSDTTDDVLLLSDRVTGVEQPIGTGGSAGRAVGRVRRPPFSFPLLAVEDDVVALLEPEPLEGDCATPTSCDSNANLSVFETILRVFRLDGQELSAGLDLAAEAAPIIDDRSLAVSNGLVFFRSAEGANALQSMSFLRQENMGHETSVSADGRFTALRLGSDVHVYDRVSDTLTLVTETFLGGGAQAGGVIAGPAISADGRWIAFASASTTLLPSCAQCCATCGCASCGGGGLPDCTCGALPDCPNCDNNNIEDVWVYDRVTGDLRIVSIDSSGVQAINGNSRQPSISGDGRHIAFSSLADDLVAGDSPVTPDVFVHDRDTDADGTFDEVGAIGTVRITSFGNTLGNTAISSDGRYVGHAVGGQAIIHDRDADDDGVYDEMGDTSDTRVDVSSRGEIGNGVSHVEAISPDGRFVLLSSRSTNLVAGDTNNAQDVFLHDRDSDGNGVLDESGGISTTLVSVASNGDRADADSGGNPGLVGAGISADGSRIAFLSQAENLVPDDDNGFADVFVHDSSTGLTRRISTRTTLGECVGGSAAGEGCNSNPECPSGGFCFIQNADPQGSADMAGPSITPNGQVVMFTGRFMIQIFVTDAGLFAYGADSSDTAADLTGDGDLADTVLQVFDTQAMSPLPVTLGPSLGATVAGGNAAFLLPEGAVAPATDLNADTDTDDDVVHLYRARQAGPVVNLSRAASAVSMSSQYIAALVSEADQGDGPLNGDGDTEDEVVQVNPVATATGATWDNVGEAADHIDVAGTTVAFLTPESAEGSDLNGDADQNDRVLQIYDAMASQLIPIGEAAEDFVIGNQLVAFRTSEASQGEGDLNGDGDSLDDILQVYDVTADQLISSGQAVIPCRLEACDPRLPYRVLTDTVKFLSLEADQGEDLNGDGDSDDLVLQTFNVRIASLGGGAGAEALVSQASAPQRFARTSAAAGAVFSEALTTIGAVSAGICTDTADACAGDADCPAGTCFVPPGGCIEDLGVLCDADPNDGTNPCDPNPCACGAGEFCAPQPGMPGQGSCQELQGPCGSDADCTAPATCNDADQTFQRLVAPLSQLTTNDTIFVGAGRCREEFSSEACSDDTDCDNGGFCGESGLCQRLHGSCFAAPDCPQGSVCDKSLLIATARDSDGDELVDPFDNCREIANVLQEDLDSDGVGDACDIETCGNGIPEGSEECDDGNATPGDGCESDCTATPAAGGPVSAKKLIVKDKDGAPDKRKVALLSVDGSISPPAPTNPDAPTQAGASLQIFNPTTLETDTYSLPTGLWSGLGNPEGSAGYKYKDTTLSQGPCKVALLKAGKLKAVCKGSQIGFTLDELAQTSMAATFTFGSSGLCMELGGDIKKDTPAGPGTGKTGTFKAKDAPAPTICPAAP
jgi:Tol biopolymer transport system component